MVNQLKKPTKSQSNILSFSNISLKIAWKMAVLLNEYEEAMATKCIYV